jgi:hypothetical protein
MNVKVVMSSVTDKKGRISTILDEVFVSQEDPAPRSTFVSIYVY